MRRIQTAILESPPRPGPLLRESRNEATKRMNQMVCFQHAISYVPSEAANIVHLIRWSERLKCLCKRILWKYQVPNDLWVYLYECAYSVFDAYRIPQLPPRIFARTIHHLIRSELVADVPLSLEIGKQFDLLAVDREQFNAHYTQTMHKFRESLWQCMAPKNWCQLIGDAMPEVWYLQGTYATWWLWWKN